QDQWNYAGMSGLREPFDLQRVPVDRVRSMIKDRLAQQYGEFVYVADVVGTRFYFMVLEPAGGHSISPQNALAKAAQFPSVCFPGKWDYTHYRVVSLQDAPGPSAGTPGAEIERRLAGYRTAAWVENYVSKRVVERRVADSGIVGSNIVTFLYHLAP